MSNRFVLEIEVIVPDDVHRENVEHVIGAFLGDLCETDRFTYARIMDEFELNEDEVQRLEQMLESVDEEEIAGAGEFSEQLEE